MEIHEIASEIKRSQKKVILIYAFNSTGKTRLSVEYKNLAKDAKTGRHDGVYYNAFSEDLFQWENDEGNQGHQIRILVTKSSLNWLHSYITEEDVMEKLSMYAPKYRFRFDFYENREEGIESIWFFNESAPDVRIKISRGEERTFVWSFFLAIFDVEGWADQQNAHMFIDDPVSSLDDNNIFVTALTIWQMIKDHHATRKIIVTSHHMGLISILDTWLKRDYRVEPPREPMFAVYVLKCQDGLLSLKNQKKAVLLYHLLLLQTLDGAKQNGVHIYHFVLLRQALENIASFFGYGQWSEILQRIGIDDFEHVSNLINGISHQRLFQFQSTDLAPENEKHFIEILTKLQEKYKFRLHTPA